MQIKTRPKEITYIVAKSDECTKEEIKKHLQKMEVEIKGVLVKFHYEPTEDEVAIFISAMSNFLFSIPQEMKLDRWTLSTITCAFDDEDMCYFIFKNGKKLNTDNFRVAITDERWYV